MAALAIACPGQGAQHPQMFALALQSPAARDWLQAYSDTLGQDVVELALRGEDLFANRNAQILICGAAGATWAALSERLAAPALFLGYSVGELAAYGCAQAWDARELALLASQRAHMMDQAAPRDAGMLAVKGMEAALLRSTCDAHRLDIAIVNADDHVVLGGLRGDLERATEAIVAGGYWCKLLDVAIPSHTPAMQAAVQPFRALLDTMPPHPTTAGVLAGIDGSATDSRTIAATLAAQISQTVRWHDCMNAALERGVTVVLEVGPGRALCRMFEEQGDAVEARAVEDFRTIDGIVKWVQTRLDRQE